MASELTRLDFLIARMPPTSIWRAVLLIEKGWMRFEVARFDEAAALFNEAADLATQSREAWARRIRDYAELSIAVCRLRQGRYVEADPIGASGHPNADRAGMSRRWPAV